jgi:hypothetical protein
MRRIAMFTSGSSGLFGPARGARIRLPGAGTPRVSEDSKLVTNWLALQDFVLAAVPFVRFQKRQTLM